MGLEFSIVAELPALVPIRTTEFGPKTPAEEDEPKPAGVGEKEEKEEEEEESCVTPKSELHILKPALVCPPAPRKPRPVKRRLLDPYPKVYFQVPSDLASFFIPLPCPARKKLRL